MFRVGSTGHQPYIGERNQYRPHQCAIRDWPIGGWTDCNLVDCVALARPCNRRGSSTEVIFVASQLQQQREIALRIVVQKSYDFTRPCLGGERLCFGLEQSDALWFDRCDIDLQPFLVLVIADVWSRILTARPAGGCNDIFLNIPTQILGPRLGQMLPDQLEDNCCSGRR